MGRVTALAVAAATAVAATAPATAVAAPAAAAAGPEAVAYSPPVDAPVAGWFRPPATPYGAGNRGVDYATAPGTPVRAAAPGQVTFAGPVGSGLHVVVLHADGVRTSYSFLASLAVRRGDPVAAGDTVGTSGPSLHFGARAGDAYVDPAVLVAGGAGATLRLVPDDQRAMGSEDDERSGLRRLLGAVRRGVAVGAEAVAWAAGEAVADAADAVAATLPGAFSVDELRVWVPAAVSMLGAPVRIAVVGMEWWARRNTCTPPGLAPPRPAGRRRVVLVAGLGSTSSRAAVDEVDTAGLGYAHADRVRFSYRGGTVAEQPYGAADTGVDIDQSGRRLRELLERIHAEDPGVPVDVIAHSQGGMVVRSALGPRAPPGVERVTTLGSPHRGADLATGVALLALSKNGERALKVGSILARAGVAPIDPRWEAVAQLAETSDFVRELNRRPVPEGVAFTSIAARADVVVAAPRSHLAGATNVVVSVPDLDDHNALPGSDVAHREMALALAGMGPTCESLGDVALDALTGEAIGTAEDVASGLVAWKARGGGRTIPATTAPGRPTDGTRPRR